MIRMALGSVFGFVLALPVSMPAFRHFMAAIEAAP
jgi:hypothetical protein